MQSLFLQDKAKSSLDNNNPRKNCCHQGWKHKPHFKRRVQKQLRQILFDTGDMPKLSKELIHTISIHYNCTLSILLFNFPSLLDVFFFSLKYLGKKKISNVQRPKEYNHSKNIKHLTDHKLCMVAPNLQLKIPAPLKTRFNCGIKTSSKKITHLGALQTDV